MKALAFGREPVLWMALTTAVVALVVAFGVELTAVQTGSVVAVVAAALGLIVRSQVTPINKPGP